MQDKRLVRTAVLGDRLSTSPFYLPDSRPDADRVVEKFTRDAFYCGEYLGGCGWPLTVRLCDDRVCHFAHHPNGPICARTESAATGGEGSADHLYIYNGLLRLAGHTADRPGLPEELHMVDKRCRHIQIGRGRTAIRVQLRDLRTDAWEFEDDELRRRYDHVQWIAGPDALGTAYTLKNRDGYVLRARCQTRGGTREVQVRVDGYGDERQWIPLTQCQIGSDGTVTAPTLTEQRGHHEHARKQPQPALRIATGPVSVPSLEPAHITNPHSNEELGPWVELVLAEFRAAMGRGDRNTVESLRAIHRSTFQQVRLSDDLSEQWAEYVAILNWLSATGASKSAPTRTVRTMPPQPRTVTAREPSSDRLASSYIHTLLRAARNNRSITLYDLTGRTRVSHRTMVRALVTIERRTPANSPLLSALITDQSGEYDRSFRSVLERLGFDTRMPENAFRSAWFTENQRVHAYWGKQRRHLRPSEFQMRKRT
ncbi:hypothetical protein KHQ06_16785 [Nocardia tengchongensis]|uniref:Integrase catalytic domain-containing protein n=1 Tax=Nocardia tengchongensis TaxID=2055889 RepID=A0ABX8CWL3_9NOCA|nr:hypothetical protein [Nocardia tengchongensis]QVI24272.1 hypothetical protein KHQ06_16785 [Nocardia tengchongensis]